jgi:hypothetical protein
MSFDARKLRVQFQFETSDPDQPQAAEEKIVKGFCIEPSLYYASCADDFSWYAEIVAAPPAVLDAEQLPLLRQRLEAQLQDVDAAEQALKGQGASS